jgi:hypothetical protein
MKPVTLTLDVSVGICSLVIILVTIDPHSLITNLVVVIGTQIVYILGRYSTCL